MSTKKVGRFPTRAASAALAALLLAPLGAAAPLATAAAAQPAAQAEAQDARTQRAQTQQPQAAAALVRAVKTRDRRAALALIGEGADVNHPEVDGTTALMWAAYFADSELVRALLAAGADVGARNDYGASAMSEAAVTGDAEVVALLLAAGADPISPIPEGQTALMAVARTGNVAAARVLIEAGAEVDAREHWGGQTALMWAAAQGHADMIRLLIGAGADANARGAVRNWERKITAEPRPKDMNKGGFTPLLYAAREACIECVRALLEGGADIDLSDPDRVSPLNLALINFHFDFAAFLIEAGADVDRWDFYGRTPLYNAVDMNTVWSAGLRDGGRNDVPSKDATAAIDIVRMLLEAGANPDIQLKLRPPYRNVPFDRGADPNLTTEATPLLRAAQAADTAAIELLLAHGANVDLPNVNGVTPLMAAAGMGYGNRPSRGVLRTQAQGARAVDMLVAAGADINARANNGRTALHGAAILGWNELVLALHANGTELEIADNQGRTPLDLAMGNYPPAFLDSPPEPIEETVALLEELIERARTAHRAPGTP